MKRAELIIDGYQLTIGEPFGKPNGKSSITTKRVKDNPYTIKKTFGYFPDHYSADKILSRLVRATAEQYAWIATQWRRRAMSIEIDLALDGHEVLNRREFISYCDYLFECKELNFKEVSKAWGIAAKAEDKERPLEEWEGIVRDFLPNFPRNRSTGQNNDK